MQVWPCRSENRGGGCMTARVPIRLEWDDPKGRRCAADAHTRVVNPYGCMVVLDHDLKLEHRVALTNVATQTSNSAVIVWKGTQRPEGGWEYGVELCGQGRGFLGAGPMKPLTNMKTIPPPSARPALTRPPTAEERRRAQRVLLRIAVVIH